ncbi:HAD family hydrolase [Saccharothrix syringae]|uniref:HAD family hydrolase n=1 Tax=Saccharothrix syringae TaxID=103733 RepID=A0A5Q0GQF7_SACSY|nr:HAD hydrolase-like protein [Saccharothrix syringae]QFZ16209.1 HAD family hydrolase [Saccharothrix syringae]
MSSDRELADDLEFLHYILADTRVLLLDFDGPICSIFSGMSADCIASRLSRMLSEKERVDPPPHVKNTSDPFEVFKYAFTLGQSSARYVEAALREYEAEAVATSKPTPFAHQLLNTWAATGRNLVVVSNNSSVAIEAYINLHGLQTLIDDVVGRTSHRPDELKPNPYFLRLALQLMRANPGEATFVGDSITDTHAAKAANMRFIGYANKPGKSGLFVKAKADIVVRSMRLLVESVTNSC